MKRNHDHGSAAWQSQAGFARVDGARLFYESAGAGPSVVFVHGFALDCRMWDDQVVAFSARYQVVRYDLRGFGRSSPLGPEPYSHAEDLKGLLDALNLRHPALVGLSMGGGVAAEFAVSFPDAARALVFVGSTLAGYPSDGSSSGRWAATLRIAAELGVAAARDNWLGAAPYAQAMARPDVAARLRAMIGEYSGIHWLSRHPGRAVDPPALRRLGEIGVPSLVLVGECDGSDAQGTADALATGIPNARKVVLPNRGHLPNMEDSVRFNQVVMDFLSEVAAH